MPEASRPRLGLATEFRSCLRRTSRSIRQHKCSSCGSALLAPRAWQRGQSRTTAPIAAARTASSVRSVTSSCRSKSLHRARCEPPRLAAISRFVPHVPAAEQRLVDALAYGIGTAMLLFARLGSPLRRRNLGRPINVRRVPSDRPPKRRLEPGRPVKTAAPGGRLFRWMRPFERRYADDSHTGRRGMRPKQAFQ